MMSIWTNEATEYLHGYLKQVAALARHQGDDADDIVNGLRDHIENEVGANSEGKVGTDVLFAALSKLGTPDEVVNLERPFDRPQNQVPIEIENKQLTLMGRTFKVVLIVWGVPAFFISFYFLYKYILMYVDFGK